MCGEFANEADGVGEEHREVVDGDFAHRGVECREELVFGEDVALAEEVHEGRFAHVGVSDESDAREFAAVFALDSLLSVDRAQFLLEASDFVEDDTSVGLNLSFAGTAHTDAATLTLEVGPHARESREEVLVLSQFDLSLGMGGLGTTGEYVEDEACAVEDLDFEFALEVGDLLGGEVVIEYYHGDVVSLDVGDYFFQLAFTDEGVRIWVVKFLGEDLASLGAGSVGEEGELVEVFLDVCLILIRGNETDEDGSLDDIGCGSFFLYH